MGFLIVSVVSLDDASVNKRQRVLYPALFLDNSVMWSYSNSSVSSVLTYISAPKIAFLPLSVIELANENRPYPTEWSVSPEATLDLLTISDKRTIES